VRKYSVIRWPTSIVSEISSHLLRSEARITKHVASTCVLDITKDEVNVMTFTVAFVEVVMAFAKSKGPQNLLSLTT
jgi:hypothetical protein